AASRPSSSGLAVPRDEVRAAEVRPSSSGMATPPGEVSAAEPRPLRGWAIAVLCYVLGVVYLGAYVRHAGVSLACADWPLCNGQLVPALDGPSGVVFAHRLAAVGAIVLLGALVRTTSAASMGSRAAAFAFGFGVLQAL